MKLLLLLLASLLALTACNGSSLSETETGSAETGEETVSETAAFLSQFTIVRGDTSSDSVTAAAVALRKLIYSELGVELNIETDWTKRGEDIQRYGREILVGPTNRGESESAMADFTASSAPLDYLIRASGDSYVIIADDEYISEAINIFYANIISGEGGVDVLSREHDFPVHGYTICGAPVTDFGYICCPEYYSKAQTADIQEAADLIYKATGARLEVTQQTRSGSGIVIGDSTLEGLDYSVNFADGCLTLGGGNYYADIRALYNAFLYGSLDSANSFASVKPLTDADVGYTSVWKAPSLIISAWMTSGDAVTTEAQIREAAEAGFNFVNLAYDASTCHDMLKWCAIYGLEILFTDWNVYGNYNTDYLSETSEYASAPNFWGNYLCDEPNSSHFSDLASAYSLYKTNIGREAFINLLPMYANSEQLGNSTYKEHVDSFVETVSPDVISVDIYPCNADGLYGGYMKNLDICATAARDSGAMLSVYIQSVSFAASKRTPTRRDLEWQSWCCMSFGARSIIYFTYMTPYSTAENFLPALIDHDLQKTDTWYSAQSVNSELEAVSDVFTSYNNIGAFSHNCTSKTDFLKFDNQYSFSAISDVKCDEALLFGCFERDGAFAFSCVNMDDLQGADADTAVSVKTDSPVVIYSDGESRTLEPDADGYVSFTLAVGDGVFCEITG